MCIRDSHDNAPIAKTKNEGIDRVLAIGSGKGGVGTVSYTHLDVYKRQALDKVLTHRRRLKENVAVVAEGACITNLCDLL